MSGAELLGVFASSTQFAVQAFKILKAARDAYDSATGLTTELTEIDLISQNAISTLTDFQQTLGTEEMKMGGNLRLDEDGRQERELRSEGIRLTSDLRDRLNLLKLPAETHPLGDNSALGASLQNPGRIAKVKKALRAAWEEKEIRDLETRLQKVMTALSARSVAIMRSKHYSSFEQLEAQIRTIGDGFKELKQFLKPMDADSTAVNKDVSELDSNLDQLDEIMTDYAYEKEILRSLHYSSLDHRWNRVYDSHDGTCDWIYNDKRTHFLSWLRKDDGVYWIHGKPGSGKSTLMKHILSNRRTETSLKAWAGSSAKLIFARHFFWISGTNPLQKSQDGLYRSLLFQIFKGQPRWILPACKPLVANSTTWTMANFNLVLQNLGKVVATTSPVDTKLAIFIDGMDEYDTSEDGHPLDIVKVVQSLSKWKNIKLCVSSRPWPVFRNEFGEDNQFQVAVHAYTFPDMLKFAFDELDSLKVFKNAQHLESRWSSLPEDIAKKAEGVWLWTRLVAKDVLRKVADGEGYDAVKELLEAIPRDLDGYFRELVERSNKQYKGEGARILLIALDTDYQLGALGLGLLLQHPNDIITHLSKKKLRLLPEFSSLPTIRDRLSNRCRDLLELGAAETMPWQVSTSTVPSMATKIASASPHMQNDDDRREILHLMELESCKVEFIHRTVRDFLKESFMEELRVFAGSDFHPKLSVLNIHLGIAKIFPKNERNSYFMVESIRSVYFNFLRGALEMDRYFEMEEDKSVNINSSPHQAYFISLMNCVGADEALVDGLLNSLIQFRPRCTSKDTLWYYSTLDKMIVDERFSIFLKLGKMLSIAVLLEMRFYLGLLSKDRARRPAGCSSFTSSALLLLLLSPLQLSPPLSSSSSDPRSDTALPEKHFKPNLELVLLLLELGADPNINIPPLNTTPWKSYLLCHYDEIGSPLEASNQRMVVLFQSTGTVFDKETDKNTAALLLFAGAEFPPRLRHEVIEQDGTSLARHFRTPRDTLRDIYGAEFSSTMLEYAAKSDYCHELQDALGDTYSLSNLQARLQSNNGQRKARHGAANKPQAGHTGFLRTLFARLKSMFSIRSFKTEPTSMERLNTPT